MYGKHHTEETMAKISATRAAWSEEQRQEFANKIRETALSRTEEEKQEIYDRVSASLTGVPHTEERCKNQSKARLGKPFTEKQREALTPHWQSGNCGGSGRFQPGHEAPETAFKTGNIPWNTGKKYSTRFTQEQIVEMKEMYEEGESLRYIGQHFGCTHFTVSRLVKGS
jgi:hypothetical protein